MSEEVPKVVAATLAADDTALEFTSSWASMLQYDACHEGYCLTPGGGTLHMSSGPRIAEARSQIIDQFFAEPLFEGAEWLLTIDSDMTFPYDLLSRMMQVAHPTEVPVLGGLCFAGGRSSKPYPTIYREVLSEENGQSFVGIEPVHDYPRDALVKVGSTGGACLLVHRNVLAAMSSPWPKGFGTFKDGSKNPYPWFVEGLVAPNGEPLGEDVAFCRRLNQVGVPIHVHTGCKLGHMKRYNLDEDYYDAWRALQEPAEPPSDPAERRQAAREALRASA